MRRLVPAVLAALLLLAGHARATIIPASPAQLAVLLHQPVVFVVDLADGPGACVDKQTVENRGKAVMSRYRIPRAEKWGGDHPTAIYVTVNAIELSRPGGIKAGCAAHVELQLLSLEDGFFAQWVGDGDMHAGPGALTGGVADDVQEFIEALVAKAADP